MLTVGTARQYKQRYTLSLPRPSAANGNSPDGHIQEQGLPALSSWSHVPFPGGKTSKSLVQCHVAAASVELHAGATERQDSLCPIDHTPGMDVLSWTQKNCGPGSLTSSP